MGKIRFILIAFLLISGKPCFGQETVNPSLDDYLEMAAKNNPEIKAAFSQYLASLEKVPQAGALPDPQASFGFFLKPMAIVGGSQVAELQLMQMFPWFGTLKIAKDEASEMARARYELFVATKADLFYRVKTNWYQLMKLDYEIKLAKENIELLESLEKLVLIKFGTSSAGGNSEGMGNSGSMASSASGNVNTSANGMNSMGTMQAVTGSSTPGSMSAVQTSEGMRSNETGLQDVFRIKMETLDQKNRLSLLKDKRETAETAFNALLNRDLNITIHVSDSLYVVPLPSGKTAIADSIINNNPMLAMLVNEVGSYTLMEQKAKKMGQPMLGVGINYMINQKREGNTFMMNGNDMFMPMVSFSIPIYRKKYNAMQSEARLMQEAGNQQTIDLKNNLLVQYRDFVQNIDDAERRITLYKEQEVLSRKTAVLLLSAFTTSGTAFEEVIRMQGKVLDYGFKHIEAITDYNTACALAEKLMNSVKY
ncbi:MAG: TolC family protein [Bacteroidetes bacterium]|nr:TolC family protein [Bacteroidota bacterium]